MNKRHAAAGGLVALLLALAAYWYWSPFLAVRELQKAAQAGDAVAFNAHVDYPKLRESLKLQLSGLLSQRLGAAPESSNPVAALGGLIGQRLITPMVDALVRPETVMAAMQNGRLGPPAAAPPAAPAPAPGDPAPPGAAPPGQTQKARWIIDRQGVDRMTAYVVDAARPDEPDSERLGLVFERSGFVDWKLTGVRLPSSAGGKP
ncbi:MAG TPA: DUF2939 domain-containing protein [Variovorax sp.]|jgi:hypothetical protein